MANTNIPILLDSGILLFGQLPESLLFTCRESGNTPTLPISADTSESRPESPSACG